MTNVTQADRLAYLSLNMLTPDDQLSVMAGNWDCTTGMQVLARHRHQAQGRLDGVEAGLEAAAKAADKICDEAAEEGDDPDYDEGSVWASMATLSELRALDPTTIANQIGEK